MIGRLLVTLRGLAQRWRLTLLWFWAACFPLLVWLYWSPSTAPPTAIGGWEIGLDKPLHAATHGFMVLIPALLVSGRWRPFAIGMGFATAIALEFGQAYVPGRSFEWFDLVANTSGALLAWWVAARIREL